MDPINNTITLLKYMLLIIEIYYFNLNNNLVFKLVKNPYPT